MRILAGFDAHHVTDETNLGESVLLHFLDGWSDLRVDFRIIGVQVPEGANHRVVLFQHRLGFCNILQLHLGLALHSALEIIDAAVVGSHRTSDLHQILLGLLGHLHASIGLARLVHRLRLLRLGHRGGAHRGLQDAANGLQLLLRTLHLLFSLRLFLLHISLELARRHSLSLEILHLVLSLLFVLHHFIHLSLISAICLL